MKKLFSFNRGSDHNKPMKIDPTLPHVPPPNEQPEIQSNEELSLGVLVEIATSIWRTRNKMVSPETGQPLDQMRAAYRSLQSAWDTLHETGLEVLDHTGEPFDTGRSMVAMAFQPTPGLNRETVIETLKPTIYFRNTQIQMGEVIVGVPERDKANPNENTQQES